MTAKTAAGMPHKTWLNKLEKLEERIKKVGEKPERWFKNSDVYQFDLIDWKIIALEVFPKNIGYDGRFLFQWWRTGGATWISVSWGDPWAPKKSVCSKH